MKKFTLLSLLVLLLPAAGGAEDPHGHQEDSHEANGFPLSLEAEKNFSLARVKVDARNQAEVPLKAIVTAGTEINLFRYRAGLYQRIDFEEISRANGKVRVRSADLQAGDEVVTEGLGFLRITEIAASGGAPAGHHH